MRQATEIGLFGPEGLPEAAREAEGAHDAVPPPDGREECEDLAAYDEPIPTRAWSAMTPAEYAEIDAAINAELNALDEEGGIGPEWDGISLAGPVEPVVPAHSWNGILVVGKSPGDAEIAHGIPMSGPTGRLLDQMLARAGLSRAETAVTNVFRMQAPWTVDGEGKKRANDVSAFFTDDPALANTRLFQLGSRYVRKGPDGHVRDLWRMIRVIKPTVILALGDIAAWAITGEGGLKGRMGEPLENPCSASPVVVTYNPAYAIHKRDEAIAALIAEHVRVAADYAAAAAAERQARAA